MYRFIVGNYCCGNIKLQQLCRVQVAIFNFCLFVRHIVNRKIFVCLGQVFKFSCSRELMALCLKKLKNLAKVKLIDANFLWTEPHSKRIKVKLAIQVEIDLTCRNFIQEFLNSIFNFLKCSLPTSLIKYLFYFDAYL